MSHSDYKNISEGYLDNSGYSNRNISAKDMEIVVLKPT